MKVVALPWVVSYFETLVPILYENGYFSFEDMAQKYVDELYDDIILNLPTRQHKPAPEYFDKYGKNMHYAVFRKSKHTQWYVFFTTYKENEEVIFLIRYIGNNHVIAQYL
jgi:hypothetical protein